jgi:transaldolase
MKLNDLNIEIYYDGSDRIVDYLDKVDGVTTNIGFLKKSNISDYAKFISDTIKLNKHNKPFSFQVFAEDMQTAKAQALKISSFSDDIFVKVPVIGPLGDSFSPVIEELVFSHGLKINTTSVYTKEQIDELSFLNSAQHTVIVSIFCGRIGDTGFPAEDIANYAVSKFKNNKNVKILWAGCQRVCDILSADAAGCDIITVPEGVLNKTDRLGKSLHDFSLKTSYDFFMDGSNLFLSTGD